MLDLIIIIFILFGVLIGFKRGIIKQSVITIGIILVLILSFILKNPVSTLMYKNLPFFTFNGFFENISSINILLYEIIAFFLVFSVLSLILTILIKISSIFEKLLKLTIILAIPSKLLGALFGLIEYYILAFIILFILSNPLFNLTDNEIFKSELKDNMLSKTPIISKYVKPSVDTINEITIMIKEKDNYSSKELNCKSIDIMKKNKIITKESLDYLYTSGKIKNKCK